ncbi:MAG: LysM peptidoglycan-binding domain-containing protein [Bacteroidota bacterium]
MLGGLVKLKIKAYSDEQFTNEVANGEFSTLLNPEKYSLKYSVVQNQTQAPGTSSSASRFNRMPPEDLDLDFLFDRTGVVVDYANPPGVPSNNPLSSLIGKGVMDDVETFKKVVFDYNGDEHRPNYLIISWGTLLFKGTLTQMDVTFKLFKADGTPLRATIRAKFKAFVEDNLRVAAENNSSPDLTHVRVVKEGDTLPLIAHHIYGDSKYYLEVAKANNITNFRKLRVGQKIFFPPIEKVS